MKYIVIRTNLRCTLFQRSQADCDIFRVRLSAEEMW